MATRDYSSSRLIWSALSIVRVNDSTDPIEICNASLEIDLFIWPPWHIIPFLGPEGKRQEYDNAAPIARADFLALEGWASLARLIHSILYWNLGGSYLSTLASIHFGFNPTIYELRAMSIRHLIFNHFSLECDLIWDYSWLKKVTMFINFGENFPLARLVDTRHLISTLEYKDLWRPWSLDPVPTLYPLHTLWFLLGVPYI